MSVGKARYGKKGVKRGLTAGGRGESIETHIDKTPARGITHAPPEKPRTDFVVRHVNGKLTRLFVYRCCDCKKFFWQILDWFWASNKKKCPSCAGCRKVPDPSAIRYLTPKEIEGYFQYLASNGIRITHIEE